MAEIVKVELQNLTRVEKDIYYLRTNAGNMRIHGSRIVADITNRSKKIFKDSIQQYVYDVPPTTYDRTGALGRGVKSRGFSKGLSAGEIYMDTNVRGLNGYFYPDSVEFGLKTRRAYWGRHYWAKGKVMALAEFKKQMEPYTKELLAKLVGRE